MKIKIFKGYIDERSEEVEQYCSDLDAQEGVYYAVHMFTPRNARKKPLESSEDPD